MQVEFKHPRIVGGVLFGKGFHTLADSHADHWFFQAQVKEGHIVLLSPPALEEAKETPEALNAGESLKDESEVDPSEPESELMEKKAPSQPRKKGK